MTSLLSRALATVRVWLGLNDPAENHLHASHGWLLPPIAQRRALEGALAPAVSTISRAQSPRS
jgi:hypothetical protein